MLTVKKPAKSLILPDKPVGVAPVFLVKNANDVPMDDPIVEFVSQIEKIKTRAEIEQRINNHSDARQSELFKLGGAVAVAQDLFDKPNSEFQGCKNFREYIEKERGIAYGKAMAAMRIYRKLVNLGIPWSGFGGIGWTKVLILVDVVTNENLKHWVAKAKDNNVPTLKGLVKAEKQKGKGDTGQDAQPITTKTFKLHPDQKELVEDALAKARDETGSEVDTVNLEAICTSFMGAGLMFSDWTYALKYAAQYAKDEASLYASVRELLDSLCPTAAAQFKEQESPGAANW